MNGWTIVFDLDGTLVDTAPDLVDATNHALARYKLAPVAEPELRQWISFGARRMIVEALNAHNHSVGEADVDVLLDTFLVYYEANIANRSRPYPGVEKALVELKRRGATLAICTNKRERLARQLLTELQLIKEFSGLAGRDTYPVHKPDPEHLRGAISLASGNLQQAIMIGDSNTDITTARNARIPSIAVSFGYTDIPAAKLGANVVIDHYDQLLEALETLGLT